MIVPVNAETETLPPNLDEALRAARAAGRAVLVRTSSKAESVPPWSRLALALQSGMELAAFSPPGGQWELLGLGAARRVVATGAGRIAKASSTIAALNETLVQDEHLADVPLWIGGFAFHHERDALAGSWRQWNTLEFVVPQTLYFQRGGQILHVTTLEVAPDENKEELRARWLKLQNPLPDEAPRWPAGRPLRFDEEAPAARRQWKELVDSALNAVREHNLRKVVVARYASARSDDALLRVAPAMTKLRATFPNCASFILRRPEGSCFVGATPEVLVATEAGTLRTMALAGTMPRGADEAADHANRDALQRSEKDQQEHRIVLDEILRGLSRLGIEVRERLSQEVVSYSNVHHLCTPVVAERPADVGLLELAAALHPTPAVCGTPVAQAYEWLAQHENWERGWYAGAVGWLDASGDGALHVALRSALVSSDRVEAFAGAGIVEASEPQREWQETDAKLRAVIDAFERGDEAALEHEAALRPNAGMEAARLNDAMRSER